jgi:hypothetical protein
LDRALAAVVVSLVRHHDSRLTPEKGAAELRQNPIYRASVKKIILERAASIMSPHDLSSLDRSIDALLDDWISVIEDQTSLGAHFTYSKGESAQRLLHVPLEQAPDEIRRRYVSGRSMRDVEPSVTLMIADPNGRMLGDSEA